MTYALFKERPSSEKVTLVTVDASQKSILFTVSTGSIYYKEVSHFVVGVSESNTPLTEASSSSLSSGEWFFDKTAKRLYIRTIDDSAPSLNNIIINYRFFFSDSGHSLPYDFDSGEVVYFEPYLKASSDFSQEIDDDNTGTSLETKGRLTLENSDGFFDELFDKFIFENKQVQIYSWSPEISITNAKRLFLGTIVNKSFSSSRVTFGLQDFVYQLRQNVILEFFDTTDGDLFDSDLNRPKRRLYGQFESLKTVGTDHTLDGFDLTGTISASANTKIITGSGTSFLSELSPEDEIIFILNGEEFKFKVDVVDSDIQVTVGSEIETSFSGESAVVSPEIPYRGKNRTWHIAGHKLRAPSTTITAVTSNNRFTVDDITDFFADDLIDVNGFDVEIKRIIGNEIILKQNLGTTPSVSDPVTKNPVSAAYFGNTQLFINRDWTVSNTSTDAIITFNSLAEFNATPERPLPATSVTFTNGSRTITGSGTTFKNDIRPRDWIRPDSITDTDWYEVLSVDSDTSLTIRTSFAGSTDTTDALRKNVTYMDDEAIVTVDTLGLERDGVWIKTGPIAVKDLLENDAGITNINETGFSNADEIASQTISISIPEEPGQESPEIKKAINKINMSIFGSLHNDSSFDVTYSSVIGEKPSDLTEIQDQDILSWSVKSRTEIFSKVIVKYSPFFDKSTGELSFKQVEYSPEFVRDLVGINRTKEITLNIFNDSDAQTMSERIAFQNSLTRNMLTIKAKLQFAENALNDAILVNLDRIYKRFGGSDRRKIGFINSIKKGTTDTEIVVNDFGNIFNRIGTITPNDADDFTSASNSDIVKNGYIVDNDLEVPDASSETELFTNLIG